MQHHHVFFYRLETAESDVLVSFRLVVAAVVVVCCCRCGFARCSRSASKGLGRALSYRLSAPKASVDRLMSKTKQKSLTVIKNFILISKNRIRDQFVSVVNSYISAGRAISIN